MDANQLLYYLRGIFENVESPSSTLFANIRNEVLAAKPVEAQLIPVEVVQADRVLTTLGKSGDCGCQKAKLNQ